MNITATHLIFVASQMPVMTDRMAFVVAGKDPYLDPSERVMVKCFAVAYALFLTRHYKIPNTKACRLIAEHNLIVRPEELSRPIQELAWNYMRAISVIAPTE